MDEKLTLLAKLLSQRGDSILNGKAKLSLQLEELLYITKLFDFNSTVDQDFVTVPTFKSPHVNVILDFLQKTKAVKLIGSNVCEIFSLKICKSLKYLELYGVPVEVLTDVEFLKSTIRTIALNRSCSDLCGFLSSDDTSTVWKHLTRANFCFNNIQTCSLPFKELIPFIRYLDLSHNDIRQLGNVLLGLKHLQTLKISFNLLEDIPLVDSDSFVTLIARNNNIKMLDGFYQIKSMVDIDLRGNCLEYIEQLSPLAHFSKLEHLFLSENPISFNTKYRVGVLKELNHRINADKFYLDSAKVTLREFDYLRVATTASVTATVIDEVRISLERPSSHDNSPNNQAFSESSAPSSMNDRTSLSPRKLQRVKVLSHDGNLSDKSDEVSELTSNASEAAEVADSMVERYGDNWLAFFEGQESDRIVADAEIDLEQLTAGLDPPEESSSESSESEAEIDDAEKADEQDEIPDNLNLENDGAEVEPDSDSLFSPEVTENSNGYPMETSEKETETIEDLMAGDEDDPLLEQSATSGTQHLVKLNDDDVFLLVHDTIVTEQDSIGQNLDKLDVQCLENFIDNASEKSIELHFDHVSPNRKYRKYIFSTTEEMYVFLKEIQEIWMKVRDENKTFKQLQCLNCQAIFPQTDSKQCSECASEHLIPYTPFEVLPTSGKYLDESGVLPREEEPNKSEHEDDESSVGTVKTEVTVSSNFSAATTHTDYTSYSTNKLFINQTNFVKADHKLELFFEMELFMRTKEVLCCYLFAQYAKYGRMRIIDCVLVVSNYMVYMCKLRPNDKPTLKCRHRLSQLKYLDIGLNYQHFRLEWESKEAAYKILVYDKEKCSKFMESFTLALPETTQITKVSDSTISNIQELVFGIDKTFELFAKGKMYRQIMKNSTDSRWGIKDRMLMLRTYENCFPGTELVDMLLEEGDYKSRAEAVEISHQLLVVDVLHHVKLEEQFHDDGTLYRFSADEPGYSAKQDFKIQENLNKDVLLYQLCYLTEKIKPTPISLIISNVKIFLTSEYHQWPLPRLQPPLPLHLRGQHFQVLHEIDISDVTMLIKNDKALTISSDSKCFDLTFATTCALDEVASIIGTLWEETFGFPLDICQQNQ